MLKRKKAEPRTPHFLSLNQDIVAWSQKVKCALKYELFIPGGPGLAQDKRKRQEQRSPCLSSKVVLNT